MTDLKLALFQHKAWAETTETRLNWLDMVAERAAKQGCNLVITPQLYGTGPAGSDADESTGHTVERLAEIAQLHDIGLIVGYLERAGSERHSAALAIAPDGLVLASYRKLHLREDGSQDGFRPGQELALFDYEGWRIAILIGYDIEFPEAARAATLAGAELLAVPGALREDHAIVANVILPARALENGVWLAFANFSGEGGGQEFHGGSRVIAPNGVIEVMASRGQEIVSAVLRKDKISEARARLPYLTHRRVFEG
jgi:predicted amidohydrolase